MRRMTEFMCSSRGHVMSTECPCAMIENGILCNRCRHVRKSILIVYAAGAHFAQKVEV